MEPPETDNATAGCGRSVRERSDRRWMEERRELVQEALLEGEERLRALLDDAMAAVYLKDLDGRYLKLNRWAEMLFRADGAEEVVGKTDHDLFPEAVADGIRAGDREALEAGVPLRFERSFAHEDGERYAHETTVFPVFDSVGEPYAVCGIVADVSGCAEERLEESEEQFRSLVQNVSDVVVVLEADGTVRYESPAMQTVLGYRPEERVGNSALDLVHPDDVERVRESLDVARGTPGIQPPVWFRMRHKNGSWRHIEAVRNSLLDDASVRGIVSTFRDITERVEAEEALKESEERFRSVIQSASDIITVMDADGTIRYESPAIERVLGYEPEERVGLKAFDYIHPEDVEPTKGAFVEALDRPGEVQERGEHRIRHKDGSWRYMEVTRNNLLDDPAVRGIVANSRDVTGRREAEEALKESEERYRAVIEQSVETIYLYDVETKRMLESNAAFREMMGYGAEELREMRIYDFIAHDKDGIDANVRRSVEEGRRHIGEREYRRKDGSTITVATSASVISYGGRRAMCAVSRDVTELKRAREALKESEARFRSLIQNAPDVITVLEADNTVRYDSPAIERVLGYEPEERVGKKGLDYIHPDDMERVRRAFAELLDKPETNLPLEYRLRHADGTWRHVESARTNLLDDPAVRGVVLNYRDVTGRKEAEARLRDSEAELRTLFAAMDGVVLVYDAQGRYLKVAPTVPSLLYELADKMIGRSVHEVLPAEQADELLECIRRALRTRQTVDVEYRLSIGGKETWFAGAVSPLSEETVVLVAHDITGRKEAEEALRQSEERYRAVIEQSTDGIYLFDGDAGRILEANPAMQQMLGYAVEELRGMGLHDLIAHDPEDIDQNVRRTLTERRRSVGERKYRCKDGSLLDVEVGANMVSYGGKVAVCAVVRDVTERKRAEKRLKESEERYRAVVEQSAESIWLFDPETMRVLEANESFCEMLGYTAEELDGMTNHDFVADDANDVERDTQESQRDIGERKYRRKDGLLIDVEVSASVIPHDGREVMCGVARDITGRKALEEQLRHRAFYDPLTELPNRALFLDRVEHALAQTDRLERPVAVLFVDLDDFKVVNDSLGHDAGNALLVEVAGRLRACVRPGDTIARLFGDEFAVLIEAPASLDDARTVAERVGEILQEPFSLSGQEVFVSASIGISLSDPAGDQPKDVLRRADLAMYTAKKRCKAEYEVFRPSMDSRAVERLDLESRLRRAVEREEFEVHYQPVVEIGSGRVDGLEALVRWRHPERGLVAPGEFIVLAEETGLIRPIGQWVLKEACRQTMRWRERYRERDLLMSVNLSTSQFSHQPDLIAAVLSETGMDPRNLQLEITERVVMDDAEFSLGKLEKLKGLGVRFAIDDYGTGYSCLYYLKRMPVGMLKIDRTFVAGLGSDRGDEAIVAGTVSLAHALGLKVVAEGVETANQLRRLEEMGCDMAQGFYFARPLPSREIPPLLDRGF